ncbi:MAG: GTPase HflX [Saccharofermentanales bacterium]
MHTEDIYTNEEQPEKAVLVGFTDTSRRVVENETERSVEELALLAETAGAQVVGTAIQRKSGIDNATYVGKGKIQEIAAACDELQAELIIFDDELMGSQIRNIEEATGRKVIDRTLLILDIFAQRARSSEGKLQVELAQLKYRYSRLSGLGKSLSRLGGGIGTRGPGESKLESDRRHIKRRIDHLKDQLEESSTRRDRIRETRKDGDAIIVAVAGYTNAGKSTLINALCNSDLYVENKLFATLDATARRLPFAEGTDVILVDTVGFIRKLPHHLIEAFNSTLEELTDADIILHVVDASDPDMQRHMEIAEELFVKLHASDKPRITVFNKIDLTEFSSISYNTAFNQKDGTVIPASALTGEGIGFLLEELRLQSRMRNIKLKLLIPYAKTGVLDIIRRHGNVESTDYTEEGIAVSVLIARNRISDVAGFVVE